MLFVQSVTLLKLNTVVGLDLSASLAMSMVDLLAAHQPALERVIIAAAVQPPKRHEVGVSQVNERAVCCRFGFRAARKYSVRNAVVIFFLGEAVWCLL